MTKIFLALYLDLQDVLDISSLKIFLEKSEQKKSDKKLDKKIASSDFIPTGNVLKRKSAKVRQKIRQKRRTKQETVGKWTWGKAKAEIYLIR